MINNNLYLYLGYFFYEDFSGKKADLPPEFEELYSFFHEYKETANYIKNATERRSFDQKAEENTFLSVTIILTVLLAFAFIYTLLTEFIAYRTEKLENTKEEVSSR